MGNAEYLDKERFVKNQGFLKEAAQYFSDCNLRMFGSGDFQDLMNHYDTSGDVSAGVSRFKEAQRRLMDLRDAMAVYLNDWEQAQENAKNQFGTIDGESEPYNGPVFSDIYQGEMEAGPNYELSQAYSFAQSGKSFSVDYNDLGAFIWTSDYGKSTRAKWGATQFSNKENYWEYVTNGLGIAGSDGNYELMNNALTASLEDMLKQLPGYEGMDVDCEALDWDYIGEELGVPGLGNLMKAVLKVLKVIKEAEIEGTEVDPDCFDGLLETFHEMEYQFVEQPWLKSFCENFIYTLVGFQAVGDNISAVADGITSAGKVAMNVQEFTEFSMQMLFHMCSSHTMQVRYLESFRESLEASGFTHGAVIEKIEQLESMYSDQMVYFTEKLFEKAYDQAFDSIAGAVSEIPCLKEVSMVMDLGSSVAKVAWGEETSAMNKLMGLYQYDEVLTRTFENYASLMEQGIATEEDVQRANDLYDMLVITKKQEYENILKIVDDKKSEWYILATEKLEELNHLPTELDLTSKEIFDMTDLENVIKEA